MGRTVPSYRIATAMERSKWKYSGKSRIRRIKRNLIKCSRIHEFTIQRLQPFSDSSMLLQVRCYRLLYHLLYEDTAKKDKDKMQLIH
jgi:hypothetical protein